MLNRVCKSLLLLVALSAGMSVHASDNDEDGIPNSEDNCPTIANANQADNDRDGVGDECDADDDGDDVIDRLDIAPFNHRYSYDEDGDGLPDEWEMDYEGKEMLPSADPDEDGLTNIEEYGLGTRPDSSDSDGDILSDGFEVANGKDPLFADYIAVAAPRGGCALEDRGVRCWGDEPYLEDKTPRASIGVWGGVSSQDDGVRMCSQAISSSYVVCSGLGQWSMSGPAKLVGFGVGACAASGDELVCSAKKSVRASYYTVTPQATTGPEYLSMPDIDFLYGENEYSLEDLETSNLYRGNIPGLVSVVSSGTSVCVVVNETAFSGSFIRCIYQEVEKRLQYSTRLTKFDEWSFTDRFESSPYIHATKAGSGVCAITLSGEVTCLDREGEPITGNSSVPDSGMTFNELSALARSGGSNQIKPEKLIVARDNSCAIFTAQGKSAIRDNQGDLCNDRSSQVDSNYTLSSYGRQGVSWRFNRKSCLFGNSGIEGCGFNLNDFLIDADEDGCSLQGADDLFPSDGNECEDFDGDGIGDNGDPDDDGDGVEDQLDAFPRNASESADSDSDGIGDNADNCPSVQNPNQRDFDGDSLGDTCDTDDDNDGVNDVDDAFPFDSSEDTDTDLDGIGNNADEDDDGDGLSDDSDDCPLDILGQIDSDGDGVCDYTDAFPNDPNEIEDTDGDGIGNNADTDDDNDGFSDDAELEAGTDPLDAQSNPNRDSDGDGVIDREDAFPDDPNESVDTDGDGIGNNADTDDDGDGVADDEDAFPLDGNESADTDGDGIGNNADTDDDNDGLSDEEESRLGTDPLLADSDGDGSNDSEDVFPLDASETTDTDGDGVGDNVDAFPEDASESSDSDGDGVGDNADAFPSDASESIDTDGDGIGNNADTDDDGDGVADDEDAFPLDGNESADTDGDGIGNNADTDDDNDGFSDNAELQAGTDPLDAQSAPVAESVSGTPIWMLYTIISQNQSETDGSSNANTDFCGQAASIPSTSSQDRIWIDQSEGVHLGASFTIEARVLVRSYSSSAGIIVDKYRSSGNQREFRFSIHSDGRLRMWYSETGSLSGSHVIYSDNVVPLDEWTHVATSYDDGKLKLFINGELEQTEEIPAPPTQRGENRIVLGGNGLSNSSRESINGLLDEVRLSDVSRYNTTFTIPTSEFTADENTLLLFHFTDGLKNDGNVAGDGILSGDAVIVNCSD